MHYLNKSSPNCSGLFALCIRNGGDCEAGVSVSTKRSKHTDLKLLFHIFSFFIQGMFKHESNCCGFYFNKGKKVPK